MNHPNFMEWVRKKLLPACRKLFPGEYIVLLADNAPYHCAIPDVEPLSKWSVGDLRAKLGELAPARLPNCTNRKQVIAALKDEFARRGIQRARTPFEEVVEAAGGTVLWLPPYHPEFQPIELFWGVTKNHVAKQWVPRRSMTTTEQQLNQALNKYGDRETVDNMFRHCADMINKVRQFAQPLVPADADEEEGVEYDESDVEEDGEEDDLLDEEVDEVE